MAASGELTDAKTMVALLKLQLWRSGAVDAGLAGRRLSAPPMKVLDLRCGAGHAFEGWFASEDDYGSQRERGLLDCPVCGNAEVRAPAQRAAPEPLGRARARAAPRQRRAAPRPRRSPDRRLHGSRRRSASSRPWPNC